mgnify:CR=1 FL=1
MDNPLVQLDPGLFVWTIITFLILLGVLTKFAWKPLLKALDTDGKALIVLGDNDPNIYLSTRNIPGVNSCIWDLLNVYQVLWHDNLVLTESAIQKLERKFTQV